MKVIIYEEGKMIRAGQLLNSISVTGASNFRAMSELADILDSGQHGEYSETPSKEVKEDAMERKEIQQDKLEE